MQKRFLAVTMALTAGLAGCGTTRPTSQPQTQLPPPQVVEAPPVPVPPPRKPKPPVRKPAPDVIAPDPSTPIMVTGLSRGEVTNTLGEPAQRANRTPGEVWSYRAPGCGVEILFLLDVVRNDLFAVESKITGTDGTVRAEQQCLQRIKTGHGTSP